MNRCTWNLINKTKIISSPGKIQQEQAAWFLDQVCAVKGCEFIINTSDNFYALVGARVAFLPRTQCATVFSEAEGVKALAEKLRLDPAQ